MGNLAAYRTYHSHWTIYLHTEKCFRNLIKSTWNLIVFTMHRLISIQTDVRLDPNQPQNGKYNQISGWFNKILKRFLCVWGRKFIHRQIFLFWLTINQTKILIVITLLRLIWHRIEFRLVLNLSEKCNYNPNSFWFNMFQKKFPCVRKTSWREILQRFYRLSASYIFYFIFLLFVYLVIFSLHFFLFELPCHFISWKHFWQRHLAKGCTKQVLQTQGFRAETVDAIN